MRTGFYLLALFAAAWASAGLLAAGYPPLSIFGPVGLSGALLLWTVREMASAPVGAPHIRRLVARWSMVEGAAIGLAALMLTRFHRIDAMFPAIALIVGLHFLPLARGIPFRLYHATGAGLVLIGAGGLLLPAAERPMVIGLGGAAMLWATIIAGVLEQRRVSASGSVGRA